VFAGGPAQLVDGPPRRQQEDTDAPRTRASDRAAAKPDPTEALAAHRRAAKPALEPRQDQDETESRSDQHPQGHGRSIGPAVALQEDARPNHDGSRQDHHDGPQLRNAHRRLIPRARC